MTPAQQIEKYGAAGYDAVKKYGTAFANEAYAVSKDVANVAANEAYKTATYLAGRADHYSKKKITIKQIIVAIIVAGLIYLIVKEVMKQQESGGFSMPQMGGTSPTTPTTGGSSGSSFDSVSNPSKTLRRGVRGVNVKELQKEMNADGQSLVEDGIFGRNTEAALRNLTGRTSITLAEYRSGDFGNGNSNVTNTGNTGTVSGLDNSKTLRRGVRGEEVKKLQSGMNLQGESLTVDGIFGANTEAALKRLTGRVGTQKSQITLTEWYAIQSSL